MSASPPASSADRLPQLDGLRGAAILFVAWHHFRPAPPRLDGHRPDCTEHFLHSQRLSDHPLDPETGNGNRTNAGLPRAAFRAPAPALYVMLLVGWLAGLENFARASAGMRDFSPISKWWPRTTGPARSPTSGRLPCRNNSISSGPWCFSFRPACCRALSPGADRRLGPFPGPDACSQARRISSAGFSCRARWVPLR